MVQINRQKYAKVISLRLGRTPESKFRSKKSFEHTPRLVDLVLQSITSLDILTAASEAVNCNLLL